MKQLNLDFTSPSPINADKLSGQNKRLYDWLMQGNRINCMSEAMGKLNIGYLNSRISDLKNKVGIAIRSHFVRVENTVVKEYFI